MTDALFGQTYYLRFDPKLWEGMRPYPPLGCLQAASYLRERGFEVALFDAMLADSEKEWAAALDRSRPRYAILFEDNFNYLSKMCLLRMREAGFAMIEMAKSRGAIVIVCGADATDRSKEYLAAGADYVLLGEGEETLGELMDALAGRSDLPLEAIQGLAFSKPSSLVQLGARRPVMKKLDELPLPAWELVDLDRYRKIWKARHGTFSINMVTTRGCPYHCNWCAKPIWGQRYNVRSPEGVVAELELLRSRHQAEHVWFADDILGLKPGWLARYAELVRDRGVVTPFKCQSRADLLLRDGEVDALARAGCEIVWIGAESGSQRVLDAMDKGTRVEQIYECTRRLHAAGIGVGFFLQFGYPGEGLDDIEKTFQMVRDCRPDEIGISVSYPLPGTKFYERVRSQLGEKQNWVDSDDLDMMYRGPFTTAFYRKLYRVMHKEFEARRAWEELSKVARTPSGLSRRHVRRAAGMVARAATLPFDRRELERLARVPHQGVGPLPGSMSHEDAARPSPQD